MSKSRLITAEQLQAKGACKPQVELFVEQTGGSLELTEAWAIEHAANYDWSWAAYNLLSPIALKAYQNATAPARESFEKAIAPAREAYDKAIAPALIAQVWESFEKAIAPAWEAWESLEKAEAPAWEAYLKATAQAFARAYINDGDQP